MAKNLELNLPLIEVREIVCEVLNISPSYRTGGQPVDETIGLSLCLGNLRLRVSVGPLRMKGDSEEYRTENTENDGEDDSPATAPVNSFEWVHCLSSPTSRFTGPIERSSIGYGANACWES